VRGSRATPVPHYWIIEHALQRRALQRNSRTAEITCINMKGEGSVAYHGKCGGLDDTARELSLCDHQKRQDYPGWMKSTSGPLWSFPTTLVRCRTGSVLWYGTLRWLNAHHSVFVVYNIGSSPLSYYLVSKYRGTLLEVGENTRSCIEVMQQVRDGVVQFYCGSITAMSVRLQDLM